MHCCAALLSNRAKLGHADKLGVAETKLLHTLHWVLIESLEECMQENSSQLDFLRLPGNSEHGLTTIQLFVYLFGPLVYSIKESDLTFRLANGLKLWRPLWEHKLPDISSFNSMVKPKRCYRLARRIWKEPEMSEKVEEENENVEEEEPEKKEDIAEELPKSEEDTSPETSPGKIVPLADISEVSRFSSGAVTPDPPSVNVEIVCEVCNTTVTQNNACRCGNLKVTGDMAAKTRFDFDQISSSSSEDETKPLKPNRAKERPKSLIERSILPLNEGFDHAELAASLSVPRPPPPSTSPTDIPKRRLPQRINDVFSATYFDVGVMRCLFIPHWAEEGVQWALIYLLHRLRQIADETMAAERVRQRSNSSPIPQITISLFSPVPGPPPKKFSVPVSCMGGSDHSKDEGRHRESYPLTGSPKKMKFERVEPLPLRKISPPKRASFGDQPRGNKTHRKLRRTSSLSKTVGALMPKLIKEETEGSGSDEHILQTSEKTTSIKTPNLGEMPKSSSAGTPKLEPFKFKIDVVQLKTVPALMSPEELSKSASPVTSPILYSTASLDSKRPYMDITSASSYVSRPTALPYPQSFSPTATKFTSFVQVAADAAHRPAVMTTQTRPFGAMSKVSPMEVIPPIKTEKSSTCFTVTKTTTSVQSTSVMMAKADFLAEHTNSTSTRSEKIYERRALRTEKNALTFHNPVSVEVHDKPLLIFDEPIKIEPQPTKVTHKATVVQHKAPMVVNRPVLQRQSPVFEALPHSLDALPTDDNGVSFEVATPLITPVMTMNNSKSPPPSPEEFSPLPEKSPSSVSSGSLLIPLSEDISEPPPPQSSRSPDQTSHHDSSSNMSTLDIPTFLPRSASDTFVNYHTAEEEEITEAAGSTYYIQEDGQMNYNVIIKALHKIITKDTSAKICDTSLHIIETILEFRVVKQSEKPSQAKIPVIKVEGEKVKAPDKDSEGDVASKSLEDMTVHNLVMETLIQVFRALGCHHGCGEGLRGHSGEQIQFDFVSRFSCVLFSFYIFVPSK